MPKSKIFKFLFGISNKDRWFFLLLLGVGGLLVFCLSYLFEESRQFQELWMRSALYRAYFKICVGTGISCFLLALGIEVHSQILKNHFS